MTIGILATGDEIIWGDTLNTNAQKIAHVLHSEGLEIMLHAACSDKVSDILASLNFLNQYCKHIIVTGGLGPTTDDRTRFAFADFLKKPLVEYSEAIDHITSRLKRANLEMNPGNRQQALFPENCNLFANPHGTAMGCIYKQEQKLFILLPGPPRECLPMFFKFVVPILQKTEHTNKILLKWRLFGVAEGEISEKLEEAVRNYDCITGYRLEMPYLEFKIHCNSKDVEPITKAVAHIIEPHTIAPDNKKASELLRETIITHKIQLSILDEVSGGLLQKTIQTPDTYELIKFNPNANTKLFFHLTGLEEYWRKQDSKTTHITIEYQDDQKHNKEEHIIPFRSANVVEYAAEWLCFRMFHILNQLH